VGTRSGDDRDRDQAHRVLVSGCINGPAIRFNATNVEVRSPIWDRWEDEGRVVSFCAELAAGFPVPRRPAELRGGDAAAVLAGQSSVVEDDDNDVTHEFILGASLAVQHAIDQGCVVAVLTDGSPSCGSTYTYDGSFTGGTVEGQGVVARALMDAGIPVFPESDLAGADAVLRSRV